MCVVCALWQKGKLTRSEALRGLTELIQDGGVDVEHVEQVQAQLEEEEELENE